MEWILAHLSALVPAFVAGAGLGIIWPTIQKKVLEVVGKAVSASLDKALDLKDPVDLEYALATVKFVEKKIPGPGQGASRFHMATDIIVRVCPPLKGQHDKIESLIEAAVQTMKAELKKREEGRQP